MDSYKITFRTVSQVNGKPTKQRHKYVTEHTDGKAMLAEIVSVFADGYEAVRLISSDDDNVDIDLIETVMGLQAGGKMPGISQDSVARTGVILVGAPERPIEKQHSIATGPSTAILPPGQPAAKAFKKGRAQTEDPQKSRAGQNAAELLPLGAQSLMRRWARVLFSRKAEAPWEFHAHTEQRLWDILLRGLLLRPELAGESSAKLENAVNR